MEYRLKSGELELKATVEKGEGPDFIMDLDGSRHSVRYNALTENYIFLEVDGKAVRAYVSEESGVKTLIINGRPCEMADADRLERSSAGKKSGRAAPTAVTPPMPAVVVRSLVNEGDTVNQGDGVIVVSAMKMETTLQAPFNGKVTKINCAAGDKVMPGDILVDIEKAE